MCFLCRCGYDTSDTSPFGEPEKLTQSLPDAAEQVAAAEKESALVRIIDDEIDVREALALMLRIEGWTAKTYPNARAFLIEDDVRRPGVSCS